MGKLPPDILDKMIKSYISLDDKVKVGPSIGEDAAVIDMGDRYLLLKTDPITFVAEDLGIYTVIINANDIATMGGEPRWLLATILLPERHTTSALVEKIFQQLSSACKEIGVSLCGGHTEITGGIDRPIVIGAMIGEAQKGSLVTTGGAREGDDIILTKSIAVEGTSVIAREKEKELEKNFGSDFVGRCKGFLKNPGISIIKESEISRKYGDIHSMHDPTEGGIATGLFEIASAAGVGLVVEEDKIPLLPECKILCQHYDLNPLGLIASGSLLITLGPEDTEKVLGALRNNGISAVKIGKVMAREKGLNLKKGDTTIDLPLFSSDEITKIFN